MYIRLVRRAAAYRRTALLWSWFLAAPGTSLWSPGNERVIDSSPILRPGAARRLPVGRGRAEEFGVYRNQSAFVRRHTVLGEDGLDGTNRHANGAIDAFIGLDVHHAPALVDAGLRIRVKKFCSQVARR